MLSWQVGRVTITRIVEMDLPVPMVVFPQATSAELRASAWLYPHFVGEDDTLMLSVHSLLVEAPGLRLIIDTCVGNDRPREITGGQPLATPYLQQLGEVGWSRDGVDVVVCTHLHVDHVGWNTMLENGAWVPTFPKARYLIGRCEWSSHYNSLRGIVWNPALMSLTRFLDRFEPSKNQLATGGRAAAATSAGVLFPSMVRGRKVL